MLYLAYMDTPLGLMRMGASDAGLCMFDFQGERSTGRVPARVEAYFSGAITEDEHPLFAAVRQQVSAYFAGSLTQFALPLHFIGNDFQVGVWKGLLEIPYGQTISYKTQSVRLGNEQAIRAIASTNGENQIAIIAPCHRVIGSDGSLTGYGGGVHNKKWLLDHERLHSGKDVQLGLF
jgi:AraC family transcriptional regulator of adaptative response/methylated-DNA-[protein]-cysteine methyltransferase